MMLKSSDTPIIIASLVGLLIALMFSYSLLHTIRLAGGLGLLASVFVDFSLDKTPQSHSKAYYYRKTDPFYFWITLIGKTGIALFSLSFLIMTTD